MEKFAVVIPFFQRQPGILAKAVDSVLAQTLPAQQIDIIVVDDASPIPARDELAGLLDTAAGRVQIIDQANAGPAAARNCALKHVPPDTGYVAFLDSDDAWIPEHLANAACALGGGADFYFADHYQLGQTVGAFQRAGRINLADHTHLGGHPHLFNYVGDMFDQILSGNIIGTSTVAYRYSRFPGLRFREEFVNAGEDYLFWLELSRLTDNIVFSSLCECTYGAGVNIFSGAGWGTEKSLARLHYEIKFRKALPSIFDLTAAQRAAAQAAVKKLRRAFVADVLHRISHRKSLEPAVMRAHWAVDPQSFLYFVPLAAAITLHGTSE